MAATWRSQVQITKDDRGIPVRDIIRWQFGPNVDHITKLARYRKTHTALRDLPKASFLGSGQQANTEYKSPVVTTSEQLHALIKVLS